jgi:hypothetical protein
LGKILYEILYASKSTPGYNAISKPAYPIFKFFKQYPLIGEIVFLLPGPSPELNSDANSKILFYFPSFALWGAINHNAFPNLEEYSEYVRNFVSQPGYQTNEQNNIDFPLGEYFVESQIKNLRVFEGDTILEGRSGQSIRFGSSYNDKRTENPWSIDGPNAAPITIIRNGQGKIPLINRQSNSIRGPWDPTVENINYDDSSIYLTSGQSIVIEDLNNFPLNSFGTSIRIQIDSTIINLNKAPVSNDISSARDQDDQAINT